jgi:hypothetical protein
MALTPYICKRVFFQNKWSTFQHGGGNTLDLILTNMKIFYEPPTKRPPFGLSDHMSVEIQPRSRAKLLRTTVTIKSRNLRSSNCLAVRLYLQSIDVSNMIGKVTSCERKVSLLETIIKTGLDAVSPVCAKRVCTSEPPWITTSLKQLIKDRQRALSLNNLDEFKWLRNCVNRERKACHAKYYRSKVQYLKNSKPSIWWKELKKLSGLSPAVGSCDKVSKSLQQIYRISDQLHGLANIANETFLSPMSSLTPLPSDYWCNSAEGLIDDIS